MKSLFFHIGQNCGAGVSSLQSCLSGHFPIAGDSYTNFSEGEEQRKTGHGDEWQWQKQQSLFHGEEVESGRKANEKKLKRRKRNRGEGAVKEKKEKKRRKATAM